MHKHLISGNVLTLLKSGETYFPRLCADIDAAEHSVHIETYIFSSDAAGKMIAQSLSQAADRGVRVFLLLDGFGSADLSEDIVDGMRMAGVAIQWFRRQTSLFSLRRSRLRRLHRKLSVIDGKIAFVGGINIINDIPVELRGEAPRLDYAVRVEGELANEMLRPMHHLWRVVSWASFQKRKIKPEWKLKSTKPDENMHVQLVLRDNFRHRRDIEKTYLKAIANAEREIIIANAYFLPGRRFPRALAHAVKRGVRVILLLQGRVEYRLQHYATLALYQRLIRAGVEIHEYQASYMHAKVAVIDGQWATVGSSNIDPFSMLLALEANIVVRDEDFAKELRTSLLETIEVDAKRVVLADIGIVRFFISRVTYILIRFVIVLSDIERPP
ncbi:MAG: cardiolipin synthase ClsB [Gallionella sp.]